MKMNSARRKTNKNDFGHANYTNKIPRKKEWGLLRDIESELLSNK